jgi:hypothetical protein
MDFRARSVLAVAVVAVVVAAPAGGVSPATEPATSSSSAEALDRPVVDDWDDTGDGEASAPSPSGFAGYAQEDEEAEDDDADADEDGSETEDETDNESGGDAEGQENSSTTNATVDPEPDVRAANVTVVRRPSVVGQPLVVRATTTNDGTAAGGKVVELEVEQEIVDRREFVLEPGESRSVTFTHGFETPGNKTFEVDAGENRFVTVRERRPRLAVSAVEVEPARVDVGEQVTVTALVRNDGHANGSLPVALELFGDVVAVENATLAAGESREVSFTRTIQAAGSYEAVVETESATLRVRNEQSGEATSTTDYSGPGSTVETPGFGSVVALACAVAAVALVLGRRR